jgi:ArsR family transcriptional regulator
MKGCFRYEGAVFLLRRNTIRTRPRASPEEEKLYDLADLFRLFGDSTRVRILYQLEAGPLCVCDIAARLDMTSRPSPTS